MPPWLGPRPTIVDSENHFIHFTLGGRAARPHRPAPPMGAQFQGLPRVVTGVTEPSKSLHVCRLPCLSPVATLGNPRKPPTITFGQNTILVSFKLRYHHHMTSRRLKISHYSIRCDPLYMESS